MAENPPPLGSIEPHAAMLTYPPAGQLLYKVMTIENLLRSIADSYLHFNRVDSYSDLRDGQQLPQDRQGNEAARFAKAPDFSAADFYDRSRARTYACCFSLENSDYIWNKYGNGGEKGKVGVVFGFDELRATLNRTLQSGNAALMYRGQQCHQIFHLNYGVIEYVDWDKQRANTERPPNPIQYTYLKNRAEFEEEKELRVSLSAYAFGMGHYVLRDGSVMGFPPSLPMAFDFREVIGNGTIKQILCAPGCDSKFLHAELARLHIAPAKGSAPPA